MKSLEERAHDFARKVYTNGQEWWEDSSTIIALGKSCYIKGAEWMIEKAVKWLKENAQNYYEDAAMHDNCWYDDEQMIEDFQKAMEE